MELPNAVLAFKSLDTACLKSLYNMFRSDFYIYEVDSEKEIWKKIRGCLK